MDPFFEYFKRERKNVSQNLYEFGGPTHKEYARFPQITLPAPLNIKKDVGETFAKRQSTRSFTDTPLSEEVISTLLHVTFGGVSEVPHYPSGGGLYPIEAYLVCRKGESQLQKGVYHYNPELHSLAELYVQDEVPTIEGMFDEEFLHTAPTLLLLTFVKGKAFPKYGALGYKLGLLEAGHIGQNVYIAASALDTGCCSLGDGDTARINKLLGIDGVNECYVYGIALGGSEERA